MAPFYQPFDRQGWKMSFMFGLGRETKAAASVLCLVCAAESLAKTSDLVTIELSLQQR